MTNAAPPRNLRLAIVSDLHAFDDIDETTIPSHLRVGDPEDEPGKHPLAGLYHLIEQEDIKADLLLCPGDIAHKARPLALQYAWRHICELKSRLSAELLAATSGNHDLDSRYMYNDDAKGVLQGLSPSYPFSDETLNDRYWARNFALIEGLDYKLLVLNSSAYHGAQPDQIAHGRVSDATLARIREALSNSQPKPANILLCHHHPQQHQELNLGDYDVMKNGQLLLDLLGSGNFGRWLVVHGHKHHPKLTYAAGDGISPVILSAGSLSANLYLELQTRARNQFHIVTLPCSKFANLGLVGRVDSWDWATGVGWGPAGPSSGLPASCGFGNRTDPRVLATKIAAIIGVKQFVASRDLHLEMPELEYLLPRGFEILSRELRELHGLHTLQLAGREYQIGRTTS